VSYLEQDPGCIAFDYTQLGKPFLRNNSLNSSDHLISQTHLGGKSALFSLTIHGAQTVKFQRAVFIVHRFRGRYLGRLTV
jgi:hypothetical protein